MKNIAFAILAVGLSAIVAYKEVHGIYDPTGHIGDFLIVFAATVGVFFA